MPKGTEQLLDLGYNRCLKAINHYNISGLQQTYTMTKPTKVSAHKCNTFMIIFLETIIANYRMGIGMQYIQWNMKMKMIVKIHLNCTNVQSHCRRKENILKISVLQKMYGSWKIRLSNPWKCMKTNDICYFDSIRNVFRIIIMIINVMSMLFNDYKSSCLLCILVCEHKMGMKLQLDHLCHNLLLGGACFM